MNISIKLEFVDNSNKFRDISAGVKFFSGENPGFNTLAQTNSILVNSVVGKYKVSSVIGFVEELIVEDDPEYNNTFTFSKSRTTNEQRRNIFYHISG